MELFQRLFNDHNVYIVPGSEFGCTEFGWFRIIAKEWADSLEFFEYFTYGFKLSSNAGIVSVP